METDVRSDRGLVLDSVEEIAWVSADTGYCVALGNLMLVAENDIPVMTVWVGKALNAKTADDPKTDLEPFQDRVTKVGSRATDVE